jgi:iron complex transport system permease protein
LAFLAVVASGRAGRRELHGGAAMSRLAWGAAVAGLICLMLFAFSVGRFALAPSDVVAVLWTRLTGGASGVAATAEAVVLQVRGPRIFAALLIGAALAMAGSAYQSVFRNPLVAPDILGVSAGAALGALAGIWLAQDTWTIQLLAFGGGIGAVALVYALAAGFRHHDPVLLLVLAGIVLGSLLGACIAMLKYLADPYNQLPAMTYWLLGSLASTTPADVFSVLPAIAAGLVVLWLLRWRINVLSMGDEEARALGIDTRRVRLAAIGAATLVTAAAVSISGVIGWIGLIVPHLARMLVGPDNTRLMPAACLIGAAFMLGVDTVARGVGAVELPLGVLTAVIGTPLFLWMLARSRQAWQ